MINNEMENRKNSTWVVQYFMNFLVIGSGKGYFSLGRISLDKKSQLNDDKTEGYDSQ